MSEQKEQNYPTSKFVSSVGVGVGIALLYTGILILVFGEDSQFQFDPNAIQIGMIDNDYCKYLLSNGACLAVDSFDQALPRGLQETCPYGFTETSEFTSGRLCVTNDKPELVENPLACNWDDCFAIGITKNHDTSIPENYLPPAMKP